MKKKLSNPIPFSKYGIKKLLLTMKLALIIVFLSVLQVSANVYSQISINLDVQNKSIREVLKSIEQQSQVRFFYSDDLLVMNDPIDIKADNENIISVLDDIFVKSPLTYKAFDNNLIVIVPRQMFQQRKINGTVTDEDGTPMPGVNIQVEGTAIGTISDVSGKFTIEVQDENSVLTFSFIGYNSQRIVVGTQTTITVKLLPDITKLDEVVVVGYGTQKKADITGSVSLVSSKDMEKTAVLDPMQALQGKAAGVNIISN